MKNEYTIEDKIRMTVAKGKALQDIYNYFGEHNITVLSRQLVYLLNYIKYLDSTVEILKKELATKNQNDT